ncbi:hypothetical protein M0805_002455 [Coniferiporia weirii]|nr:hypothetical protein M0805_002455 [Coniferiporia weirii]
MGRSLLPSVLLSFFLVAVTGVGATRPYDQSKPCFHGVCSFDIPPSHDSIGGTLVVTGAPYAISDVSPSSGWEILDCSPEEAHANTLRVHLACSGDPASCAQLYERGAEHTLVRLPDDCGEAPFARVASATAFDDQAPLDLPPHVLDGLDRRGINHSKARILTLDTEYAAASHSKHGPVSFFVVGSTVPGFSASGYIDSSVFARQRGNSRNLARDINDALEEMLFINENISWAIPALNVDRSLSIFNASVPCAGREDAVVNVNVHAKADANITLGLSAVGTFFPPRVTRVGVYAGMTAELNSDLDIFATATGSLDTGAIGIFSADLPTLGVKGILSVTPKFDVSVSARAFIDTALDARLGATYRVDTLQLVVPSQEGASSAAVAPTASQLQLSVRRGASSNASLEVHLVPTVRLSCSIS